MENEDQASLDRKSILLGEIEKLRTEVHLLLKNLEDLSNILQPLRRTQQELASPESNKEGTPYCSSIVLEIKGIQQYVSKARNMIDDIVTSIEI